MVSDMHDLKKQIFYDMLALAGRVFVVVRHSEGVEIGSRGFLPAEREKGLVLVFNSRMNFSWDDSGISAKLVFGSTTENCFIPHREIVSIFSPELSAQFSVSAADSEPEPDKTEKTLPEKPASDSKVVKVDFNKKK